MVAAQSYRALNWWLSFHGAREMLAWSSDAPSLQNNFIRVCKKLYILRCVARRRLPWAGRAGRRLNDKTRHAVVPCNVPWPRGVTME